MLRVPPNNEVYLNAYKVCLKKEKMIDEGGGISGILLNCWNSLDQVNLSTTKVTNWLLPIACHWGIDTAALSASHSI